jgi:hypothetical protein
MKLLDNFSAKRRGARVMKTGSTGSRFVSVVIGLAAAALYVRYQTKRAERENPPEGKFVEVDGIRLHYVEKGQGQPLVLLP